MKKILLPIKPKYVEQILSGKKKVEYRKRLASQGNVDRVLIYASSPVKLVVAEFTIAERLQDTPSRLWEQTSHFGGITHDAFTKYFEGCSVAYAYSISKLYIYSRPIPLSDYGLTKAPQNFCYIEDYNE